MTRVLFIIPLAIVLSGIYRTKSRNSNEEKVSFPLYVLLFVLMLVDKYEGLRVVKIDDVFEAICWAII